MAHNNMIQRNSTLLNLGSTSLPRYHLNSYSPAYGPTSSPFRHTSPNLALPPITYSNSYAAPNLLSYPNPSPLPQYHPANRQLFSSQPTSINPAPISSGSLEAILIAILLLVALDLIIVRPRKFPNSPK